jgi:predicted dehydrogenase
MARELKIAIIGLDTSHAVEFPKRMHSPEIPQEQRVAGMKTVACMKFMTPFTTDQVLAERTATLESWGVKVTGSFDEAVADCDAILLEVNDPAYHLEYFTKCAALGKPIFLDKPMADTIANAQKIVEIAEKKGIRFFTSSSLRFVPELETSCAAVGRAEMATIYGPLGKALAGSSIVWYGVHAFEMLERAMGTGATSVTAVKDAKGAVVTIGYGDGRRGVVELTEGNYQYGGLLRSDKVATSYLVEMSGAYTGLLKQVVAFLKEGTQPVAIADSLEVMKLLDATERSYQTGKPVTL